MKYYIIFILWIIIIPCHWGQSATEEAFEKSCNCLTKVALEDLSYNALDSVLEDCIKEGLYTNLTGVLQEQGAILGNDTAMARVAVQMHQYLSENCIAFRNYNEQIAQQKVTSVRVRNPADTGLAYSLETQGRFPVLSIINSGNEMVSFYWVREFDGSTRFFEGIKDYQNTKIEVLWRTIEIYDATNQKYQIYKEIYQIEELGIVSNKEKKKWIKAYKKRQNNPSKSKKRR